MSKQKLTLVVCAFSFMLTAFGGSLAKRNSVEATAVSNPTPSQVQDQIRNWAAYYGIDGEYLISVAECEDPTLDIYARGIHGEIGVFQWMWPVGGIWQVTPDAALGLTPWDWESNVRMAAWAFANGWANQWVCSGVWGR